MDARSPAASAAPPPRLRPEEGAALDMLLAARAGDPMALAVAVARVGIGGLDIDRRHDSGMTALMLSAKSGSPDCVSIMVRAGAKLDAVDGLNRSALWLAAGAGSSPCVEILCEAGADVELRGHYGFTPAMQAAWCGHAGCLLALIGRGADPHAQQLAGPKESAAELATREGKADCLSILLRAGVDPERRGVDGFTLAMKAASYGKAECLDILGHAGADMAVRGGPGHLLIPALALASGNPKCQEVAQAWVERAVLRESTATAPGRPAVMRI